jgi:hypothetical protein
MKENGGRLLWSSIEIGLASNLLRRVATMRSRKGEPDNSPRGASRAVPSRALYNGIYSLISSMTARIARQVGLRVPLMTLFACRSV